MGSVIDINQGLVELCKTGSRKAQYELYRLYSKAMFNVAMRITNNYMEAEDVLQEAFVRAFRNLQTFKGDSTFGAWLKRIVINTSINHLKKNRLDLTDIEPGRIEVPDNGPKETESDWNMDQIRGAIAKLPDGYRLVFNLYLLEGYDHEEIGNILQISESTSKSQYSRAKKKLRALLTEMR